MTKRCWMVAPRESSPVRTSNPLSPAPITATIGASTRKAAALVHAIVSNHGFVDGNKRTAVYLVELLAVRSGYRLAVEDLVLADVMIAVARGELDYEELATWFKGRLEPVTGAEPDASARRTESADDE